MIISRYINGTIFEILNILCNDFISNLDNILNNNIYNFLQFDINTYENIKTTINNIQLLLENNLLENSLNKTISNFDDFFNSFTTLRIELYYLTIKFNNFYNYKNNNMILKYNYILIYIIKNIYSIINDIYLYLYKKYNNIDLNDIYEIDNIYEIINPTFKYNLLTYTINNDIDEPSNNSFVLPILSP